MFSKADIEKYFNAEKKRGRLLMIIGIGGILLALNSVFPLKGDLYKGMILPMTALGVILALAGIIINSRSDRQCRNMVDAFENNPAKLKDEELPRMKKIMKRFVFTRWVEIILFITGAILYVYFIRDFRHDFWRGLGFALAFMTILALSVDYYAEKRGHIYTQGLESFINK